MIAIDTNDQPTRWETFITAVQFLTRIPVRVTSVKPTKYYRAALRRSVVFFPFVGGLIGLVIATVLLGCLSAGLSPLVAALVTLGFEAALTGAFHEDAFADTWDALGGGWSREQVLEIMKDSRLGTYGTVALILGVGCRAAAIASLAEANTLTMLLAVIASSSIGRIAMVVMMVCTRPIEGRHSHAKDVSDGQTLWTLTVAMFLSLPFWLPWMIFDCPKTIAVLVLVSLALYWFRRKILIRVGGTTGDLLGSTAFMVQLIVLIGSSAIQ